MAEIEKMGGKPNLFVQKSFTPKDLKSGLLLN